jgi:hypothetical protein
MEPSHIDMANAVAVEAVKAAPPVIVTFAIVAGGYVAPWITLLTFLYIVMQIAWLIYRVVKHQTDKVADDE